MEEGLCNKKKITLLQHLMQKINQGQTVLLGVNGEPLDRVNFRCQILLVSVYLV